MIEKIRQNLSFEQPDGESPKRVRLKQLATLGGGMCLLLVSCMYLFSSSASENEEEKADTKPVEKDAFKIETPPSSVDEKDIWVNRVQKQTKEVRDETNKVKEENQFLQKRIDVLEDLFKQNGLGGIIHANPKPSSEAHPPSDSGGASPQVLSFPTPKGSQEGGAIPEGGSINPPRNAYSNPSRNSFNDQDVSQPMKRRGAKILHVGRGNLSVVAMRHKDMYLPAGSYSKAVLSSGVAASTATNAQGNPQPIMLRLVDDGNLPRGFKSRVRDAVLLGACYGDISSERVFCRLESMSWVESNGTTVEKKVEGWVMGEDGRSGLRGEVVDRSNDVARESLVAGMLAGIGSFFQAESFLPVYPVSPFGITNAPSTRDVVTGAVAEGAGNALNKLAEFSIRKAEQMQPVILVASGRVVDVVFKSGVDLSQETQEGMKVVGSESSRSETPEN